MENLELSKKNPTSRPIIGIVGGGVSGVSCALNSIEIFRKNGCEVEIILFEKSSIGGLAFSKADKWHSINTRAENMGIYSYDRTNFKNWILNNMSIWQSDFPDFSPYDTQPNRAIYGYYLEEMVAILKNRSDTSQSFKVVFDEVLGVTPIKNYMSLELKENSNVKVDCLVVALGNETQTDRLDCLSDSPNYISRHYPSKTTIGKVNNHDKVGIIGTSLSAFDAVQSMINYGHEEEIYLISPSGLLPKVQNSKRIKYNLQYLSTENLFKMSEGFRKTIPLKKIMVLLRWELEAAHGKKIVWKSFLSNRTKMSPKAVLQHDILAAQSGKASYQDALNSLSDQMPLLSKLTSVADQKYFNKHYKSIWNIYKHPMILKNSVKLRNYMKNGQVKVLAGFNQENIFYNGSYFEIKELGYDKQRSISVKYLVNATGTNFNLENSKNSLINSLRNSKIAWLHPFGGFHVNNDLSLWSSHVLSGQIYACGSLTVGHYNYVSNVKNLVDQADIIANSIFNQFNSNNRKAS